MKNFFIFTWDILKRLWEKVPAKPKYKKIFLILLTLFMLNKLYWYRGFFHQTRCEYIKYSNAQSSFYTISTAPIFGWNFGFIELSSDMGAKIQSDFLLITGTKYKQITSFNWSKNIFSSYGVLSMRFDWGDEWTVGNITYECWQGLERYVSKLDSKDKPLMLTR